MCVFFFFTIRLLNGFLSGPWISSLHFFCKCFFLCALCPMLGEKTVSVLKQFTVLEKERKKGREDILREENSLSLNQEHPEYAFNWPKVKTQVNTHTQS